MDSFVFNLSGGLRQETLKGVDYLVADATLIVPGVLDGSEGPLLYPADEVKKNVDAWNGIPLLVNHPPKEHSARDVIGSQGIGRVGNAEFVDNKLRASLWFNVERTKALEPRIFDAVSAFQKVEISTGLGMDAERAPKGAVFNNPIDGQQKYTHTVSNLRPDHLAVLTNALGACSVRDGCGVNNEATEPSESSTTKQGGRQMAKLTDKQKKAIVNELIENECCWEEEHRDELMGMSDVLLNQAKVAADKQTQNAELLTAATAGFNTDRDEFTFNLEKRAWDRETKSEKKDKEDTVDNTGPTKPLTEEEFIARAPEGIRNSLAFAKEAEQAERKRVIEQITANVSDDAKPDLIATFGMRPMAELRKIASLIPAASSASNGPNHYGGQPPADIDPTTNEADQDDQLIPPELDWNATSELVNA